MRGFREPNNLGFILSPMSKQNPSIKRWKITPAPDLCISGSGSAWPDHANQFSHRQFIPQMHLWVAVATAFIPRKRELLPI